MCGIVGVLGTGAGNPSHLDAMRRAVQHRGPDDCGIWFDEAAGVGLGHARLSIIDLTAAGHQPMHSTSGRYAMVFNGEIYNHTMLRAELERAGRATGWRGHSDSETLCEGFDAWGIAATITRSVGMFALAVWDREARLLTLVRDRLGEKPLYYGWQGDVFLFGSELKALRAHPAFRAEIDRGALALLMRHNYIPAPHSIFQGIAKQQPGTLLTVSPRGREIVARRYWDVREVVADGTAHPFEGSADEAVEAVRATLHEAIGQQMVADVPLGAFLSGGVDSSTVVAMMQEQSSRPVRTFTIGFREDGYNEAEHAKAVARHLGTDHTELYVSPGQALEVIPRLPALYCEPFADPSQIPTFLVSKLAREHVTVSLSGDAGDELFGGYQRYDFAERLWGKLSRLPLGLRLALARAVGAVPARQWNRMLGPVRFALPFGLAGGNAGDRIVKGAELLQAQTPMGLYRLLVSLWTRPEALVIGATEPPTALHDAASRPGHGFLNDMMELDQLTYLPDDILAKVDRAAMGVSLETRVPFLDHRLVELAWRLPVHYKRRDGMGKWALRQVLYRYVPRELIERPKMGFGVPIDAWLRGPLRDWAEDLLDEPRLRQQGFFQPAPIREKWAEHCSGARNWQYLLWNVLMFQAWLNERA